MAQNAKDTTTLHTLHTALSQPTHVKFTRDVSYQLCMHYAVSDIPEQFMR